MQRPPLLGALLNASRTARQVLTRRNAFEELAAADLPAPRSGPKAVRGVDAPLELRDLASNALWLLACRNARSSLSAALGSGDQEQVETGLARLGSLLRMSHFLVGLGIMRPAKTHEVCHRIVERALHEGIRQGLASGVVVPGATRGVSAEHFLKVRMEPSTQELVHLEAKQRQKLELVVQACFAGGTARRIPMADEDLDGLPEHLRKAWASRMGSWAVWRSAKFSLPADRGTLTRVLPFVRSGESRRRVFEAYFEQVHKGGVHEAALELLRTRQRLARQLGFDSWAAYELRALAASRPEEARRLMDSCWKDAQRGLAPMWKSMDEFAGGAATASGRQRSGSLLEHVSHADEAFYRAHVTHELDVLKLAEFLSAPTALRGLLDVVGQAYNVRFQEARLDHISSGWRSSVSVLEMLDSGPHGRRLGFVYVELEQQRRWFSQPLTLPPGASLLSPGHVYLGMNFSRASRGHTKLLNFDEATMIAHELGHAVHMLCQSGTTQDWDDQPLDLIELPSTLAETVATHPAIVMQYARHHASGGPPQESLAKSCSQAASRSLVRYLQSASVSLGLHSEAFDAEAATPDQLRAESVALWQRYSPVVAHPNFTPFGEDAGLYLAMGSNHVAYLLCHMRADALLHGGQRSRTQDLAKRWLSPEFAGKLRAQLLDRSFSGQRLATLMPPPVAASTPGAVAKTAGPSSGAALHPLPPLPVNAEVAAGLFARKFGLAP
mmetsp:Transcript_86871/g.280656  ORF Transcript_86871/g.280656 Transcript_86871/m.280656 type:complete len:725 (+) Transcript_86871:74-2248(+)